MGRCACGGANESCHYCGGTGFLGGIRPRISTPANSPKRTSRTVPTRQRATARKTTPPPRATAVRVCGTCGAEVKIDVYLTHTQGHKRLAARAAREAREFAVQQAARRAAVDKAARLVAAKRASALAKKKAA